MILNKFFNLNFLFMFVITIITVIGVFALYSAADGNFYPWAIKHSIRYLTFFVMMIIIALVDLKLIFKYAYIFFL